MDLFKGFTLFKDKSVALYNPRNCSLSIGSQPVKDFADEIINITYLSDNINVVKGIDGNPALLRQTNSDAEITFSLLQMSQTNKWLLDMQSKMLDKNAAIELTSVTFSDYNLKVSWRSANCFIKKHPEITYSKMAGSTSWTMYCIDCKINQNISVDDSFYSSEEVLFRKVGEAVKSVGKKITAIFS